jgi:hypothetical protein
MQYNEELIIKMRSMCAAGESLASIIRAIKDDLAMDQVTWFAVAIHLRNAFKLDFLDTSRIEASELNGGQVPAEEVEGLMLPKMRKFVASLNEGRTEARG